MVPLQLRTPGSSLRIIIFASAFLSLTECFLNGSGPVRARRQVYECSFRCSSGDCIDVDKVCDGARDCGDGSDETRQQCSSNSACPGLSFRCDYGACVDADARCNGVNDCVDGSDEHHRICRPGQTQRPPSQQGLPLNTSPPASGGCRDGEYRCASGEQCVDNTVVCDGRKDCRDGSDETYTQCYSVKCPSYSFRCAYGGCIDREGRCDGVRQCADGSDEDPSLCRGSGPHTTQRPSSSSQRPRPTASHTQTTRPQQTQRPSTPSAPSDQGSATHCYLPAHHRGGSYSVHGCTPRDTSGLCRGVANTPAPDKTVLYYTCEPGYQLSSETNNLTVCLFGSWNPEPPKCAKTCPALISTSVDLECSLAGRRVRCDKIQLPGTRATLKCKSSYRFPAGVTPDYDAVNCQQDGTWDWPLFKCIPECGVAIGKGQTLIIHGNDAAIGDFPWHAGIYDTQQKTGITQVCGGTLVLPNLVVSAAHCYYDEKSEKGHNPSRFKVAVGKYYRDWDAEEKGVVQRSDVVKIHLPDRYRGRFTNYANDIALLELTIHVSISAVVMPICVDWLGNTLPTLRKGDVGTVVGWGRTSEQLPSPTLQSARLPFVPFDECLDGIPETFRPYVTSDKFCAGNINGSAVARGDSGGGLAFKDKTAWFLRGIVSAGVPNTLTYSAFTNVVDFRVWMSEIRAGVENKGSHRNTGTSSAAAKQRVAGRG